MNYITKLRAQNAILKLCLTTGTRKVTEIRAYLQTDKFVGTEADGGRKDWISTSELDMLLNEITNAFMDDGVEEYKRSMIAANELLDDTLGEAMLEPVLRDLME